MTFKKRAVTFDWVQNSIALDLSLTSTKIRTNPLPLGRLFKQAFSTARSATFFSSTSKTKYSDMMSIGVDVSAGAQINAAVASAGADMSASSHYKSEEQFNSTMSSYQVSCVGAGGACPPPSKVISAGWPDIDPWKDKVAAQPIPLKFNFGFPMSEGEGDDTEVFSFRLDFR